MKKLILSVAVIAVFGFTSCSSDDDGKSCEQLNQDIVAAFEAYFDNDTEANCNAYKAALQAYVNKNCEGSAQIQTQIDMLGDCSQD